MALIEPERLLVDVTEEMEGFHENVGPMQAALQQTLEIFHAVGVNLSVDIGHGIGQ